MVKMELGKTEAGKLKGMYSIKAQTVCPWLNQESFPFMIKKKESGVLLAINPSWNGDGKRSFIISLDALEYALGSENRKLLLKEVL